jgi:hypothetical protein
MFGKTMLSITVTVLLALVMAVSSIAVIVPSLAHTGTAAVLAMEHGTTGS